MKRRNKWFLGFGTSLVLGIVLLVFTVVVIAASATSAKGYYTVGSYNYHNDSTIQAGEFSNGVPYAQASSRAGANTQVPAGYMGAKGRLFNENNQLVVATSYTYNSVSAQLFGSELAQADPAVGGAAYYSKGITAAYNGNGYDLYYTFESPKLNAH